MYLIWIIDCIFPKSFHSFLLCSAGAVLNNDRALIL